MLPQHSDLLPEMRDALMAETTPSSDPAPTLPDPRYADTQFLHRVVDEYEAEARRLELLTEEESVPLTKKVKEGPKAQPSNDRARRRTKQSTHFETDQKVVKQAQKLWDIFERVRAHGTLIQKNRLFVLDAQQPLELLASQSWNRSDNPLESPTPTKVKKAVKRSSCELPNTKGNLSLNPAALEPERQLYRDEVRRVFHSINRPCPQPDDLLHPGFDWGMLPETDRVRIAMLQQALLIKAARLATAGELQALGLWFPAHAKDSPPLARDSLVAGFARSFLPGALPYRQQLLEVLWSDNLMVSEIDEQACTAFEEWPNHSRSGPRWWQTAWLQLPDDKRCEPSLRRKEFVVKFLDDLVGLVIRNGRGWAMELELSREVVRDPAHESSTETRESDWRGWLLVTARDSTAKAVQRLSNAKRFSKTGRMTPGDSEDPLASLEARNDRRKKIGAFFKAESAFLATDLTEDEHNVIALRYFLSAGDREMPRSEVARLLGKTESEVTRLEKSARNKMAANAARHRLEDPVDD
jgi:hypothetical protein